MTMIIIIWGILICYCLSCINKSINENTESVKEVNKTIEDINNYL